MKQLITTAFVTVLFSIFSLLAAGQSSEKNTALAEKTQQADTLRFSVYGMDCPGCAEGLEKQVNKLSTVKASQADWRKQLLEVVVLDDSLLRIGDLNERVKNANFTLDKKHLKED